MSNPNQMKCLYKESQEAKPYITEIPIPTIDEGQLLIRMDYAPINPSDVKFLQGKTSSKKLYPCVPGFEGSGTVVLTGGGISVWGMAGKRVAFYTDNQFGTYGEYCVANTNLCIELDNDIQQNEAACAFVNPLSVIGMYDVAKKLNAKAVINNPGASQLGKMMNRYFKEKNIQVINIVRKEEQFNDLKYECSADLIINSNEPDFLQKLKVMCQATQASIYFDAVGGEQSGKILNIMPKGSTLMMYGTLESWQIANISPNNLLKENKSIQGFFLHCWLAQQNKIEMMLHLKSLKQLIKTSLKTKVIKEFSLEQFQEAADYQKAHMTEGKVLISMKKIAFISEQKFVQQQPQQVEEKQNNEKEKQNEEEKQQQQIKNVQEEIQQETKQYFQGTEKKEEAIFQEDDDSDSEGFGESLNDALQDSEQK